MGRITIAALALAAWLSLAPTLSIPRGETPRDVSKSPAPQSPPKERR